MSFHISPLAAHAVTSKRLGSSSGFPQICTVQARAKREEGA